MKRSLKILAVVMLIVSMFACYASALSFEVLDNEQIFSEETIKKEKMSSYARDEIMAAREAGLIPALSGNPAYTAQITREQFAELVVRMVEVTIGKEVAAAPATTFPDTTNISVLKANKMEVVGGRTDGTFDPNATATRQEIAAMIARAIDYIERVTGDNLAPTEGDVSIFVDNAKIQSYAKAHIARLNASEIMKGSEEAGGLYARPAANCKVEDSILLLYRTYTRSL